jgi:amino acid adenylation domain-containing protein
MSSESDQYRDEDFQSVAIIGMAGRFPGAPNLDAYWKNLSAGIESIVDLDDEQLRRAGVSQTPDGYIKRASILNDIEMFDADFFGVAPSEAALMDPQHRLLLECAYEAIEHAAYNPYDLPKQVGVYTGVSLSDYLLANLIHQAARLNNSEGLQVLMGNDKSYASTRISHKLGLQGPSLGIDTACSTALVTIHQAARALLTYECDMAIAGAAKIAVPQAVGYRPREGDILSSTGQCRPFDEQASGTIHGSGGGVIILKRLVDAIEDKDQIHAVIRGSAINNDGNAKIGYTAPGMQGQTDVIIQAMASAGVKPSNIDYIEAHGTGTNLGDPIEVLALKQAFGADVSPNSCAIGSVKGNIGHLDVAAGMASVIKVVLAMKHRKIPPSLHFKSANKEIDFESSPFFVNTELTDWTKPDGLRTAGVSAFGIGGTNAHLILEELDPRHAAQQTSTDVVNEQDNFFCLSAQSISGLNHYRQRYVEFLQNEQAHESSVEDICLTSIVARPNYAVRCLISAKSKSDLLSQLTKLEVASPALSLQSRRPVVVYTFTGQGSQYPGMARELYATSRLFREHFDEISEVINKKMVRELRYYLWEAPEEELNDTLITQLALLGIELALARFWRSLGILPDYLIGHSMGEVVAACFSGMLSLEDAAELVFQRATAMKAAADDGAMLAVAASAGDVLTALASFPSLSIAAFNSPCNTVVSGDSSSIEQLSTELQQKSINITRLRVSKAFHSKHMDDVLLSFGDAIQHICFKEPEIAIISSVEPKLASAEMLSPQYWVDQIRKPVRYQAAIQIVLQESANVFVEIGSHPTLTNFARQSFSNDQILMLTSLHEQRVDSKYLTASLARYYEAGGELDWTQMTKLFNDGQNIGRRVELPTYPFQRTRHWLLPDDLSSFETASTLSESAVKHKVLETDLHDTPQTVSVPLSPDDLSPLASALNVCWRNVLGVAVIRSHDNFFDLGGHSLMILQLTEQIKQSLGLSIPNHILTENSTFEDFCVAAKEFLASGNGGSQGGEQLMLERPLLEADLGNRHELFPLVELQQSFLVGRRSDFGLGGVSTHLYFELNPVDLDLARFTGSLNALIQRHDMLRAVIVGDSEQRILEHVPHYEPKKYAIEDVHIDGHLHKVREEMSHQILPEEKWPLFDFRLTQHGDGQCIIHVSMDLLMLDVRSNQILFRDLDLLYAGKESDLPLLPISYRDYVIAEQKHAAGSASEQARNYWLERVSTFPLAPDLPLVGNPVAIHSPRFKRHLAIMDLETSASLHQRAAQGGVTLSALLVAVYGLVLSRWSKSSRFSINMTMFNRVPLHPCVDHLVGDFTSVSLLALDFSENASIVDHAQTIQKQYWRDVEHRSFSGVQMLRELTKHYSAQRRSEQPIIMPVVFTSVLPLDSDDGEFEDLGDQSLLRHYDEDSSISQTPQVWLDHVASEEEGHLLLSWDSIEGLFSANMVESMFEQYKSILTNIAEDEKFWQQARLDLLPSEQKTLRESNNQTEHLMSTDTAIDRYLLQVKRRPNSPVILSQGVTLSYAELHCRVVFWSRWLISNGVGKGDYVGIIMEKAWQEPVAVLAINLIGAAYVPINTHWPIARQLNIIESIDLKYVLTQSQCVERLERLADLKFGVVDEDHAVKLESLDALVDWVLPDLDDCTHVIFTSGSSGLPKGVIISHRAMANTVFEIAERFDLNHQDRILSLSAITFDLSVLDMFSVFSTGAALVIPQEHMRRDSEAINLLIDQHQVSMINAVPAIVGALIDHREMDGRTLPDSLRLVIMGGDFIPVNLPNRIRSLASDNIVIMSMGGPTETVIYSIGYEIGEVDIKWRSIPYGSAMRNRKCWVVDDQFNDRPEGVPGEIITGGNGVLADGYWGNSELTKAKFTTHPDTGDQVFKTGDMGLYLPSGEIEILGRRDFQVKINGFRVELSEIENILGQHADLKEIIVNAQRSNEMASSLIAYGVMNGGVALKDIQPALVSLCKEHLPEYMVPHVFIELENLPLSANGKVDRNALPEYTVEHTQHSYVAPSNEFEDALLKIWRELFVIDEIGVKDNFFDLGGHSLIAMKMLTLMRKVFDRDCSIGDIFGKPTIEELAGFLNRQSGVKKAVTPLEKAPKERHRAPSFAQQRLWFIDQLDQNTEGYYSAYNMPLVWKIEGALNGELMRQAIQHLTDRHSVLRTAFKSQDGVVVTEEQAKSTLPWTTVDLTGTSHDEIEQKTWQLIKQECELPFDLTQAPLIRGLLITESKASYYLVITLHHIATDAWSIALMSEEILSTYQTLVDDGELVLSVPALQYDDFAHWQHHVWESGQMQAHEDYWLNKMEPLPQPLMLPVDFGVPKQKNYLGEALPFTLDTIEVESIDRLASEFKFTSFITLISAFSIVLSRHSSQADIVVGTDTANRFPAQTEEMLGYFINQVALRVEVNPDEVVAVFLENLKSGILQDLEHDQMPFDRLIDRLAVDRDLSTTPLFQVKLNYHSVEDANLDCGELNIESQLYDFSAVQYDVVLTFKRVGNQVSGTLQYRKELFSESSMMKLIEHFRTVLLSLGDSNVWHQDVKQVSMQKAQDIKLTLAQGAARKRYPLLVDATSMSNQRSETLLDRVNRQIKKAPNRIALQDGNESLTYHELGLASDQLASLLISKGVAMGDFVGLYLERGAAQIVGILAILKAGGAYVPLDPRSPVDRLNLILQDAEPVYVITDQKALELNPLQYHQTLIWEDLSLDKVAVSDELSRRVNANMTAYIIYTSGTTGRPNGVMVSHHNVTRLLDSCQDFYQFNENDVWSLFHSYVFDFSVWELWGALSFGGKLVIVPHWTSRSPEKFHKLLVEQKVTVLCQTPSAFQQVNQYAVDDYNVGLSKTNELSLRYIIFGGEMLDIPSLAAWFDCFGDEQPTIVNMYGITETTVHASLRRITKEDLGFNRSAIGSSINDLDFYVLDEDMQVQAIGLPGELYVAGDGLAQGYRNRAQITACRFIPNPYSDRPGARLYKSGDLARWTYDGDLEYLGRIDHQLQIRGHRVELGEIEFHLSSHVGVEKAIVLPVDDESGVTQLVAYWIASTADGSAINHLNQDQFNAWLSEKIPSYMLPNKFVSIEVLPLTINGKVDRVELTKLAPQMADDVVKQCADTETEFALLALVCDLLSVQEVGVNQNFFMIGGHSLLATQLNARIRTQFGVDLALKPIFESINLQQLAGFIDAKVDMKIVAQVIAQSDAAPNQDKEEFIL